MHGRSVCNVSGLAAAPSARGRADSSGGAASNQPRHCHARATQQRKGGGGSSVGAGLRGPVGVGSSRACRRWGAVLGVLAVVGVLLVHDARPAAATGPEAERPVCPPGWEHKPWLDPVGEVCIQPDTETPMSPPVAWQTAGRSPSEAQPANADPRPAPEAQPASADPQTEPESAPANDRPTQRVIIDEVPDPEAQPADPLPQPASADPQPDPEAPPGDDRPTQRVIIDEVPDPDPEPAQPEDPETQPQNSPLEPGTVTKFGQTFGPVGAGCGTARVRDSVLEEASTGISCAGMSEAEQGAVNAQPGFHCGSGVGSAVSASVGIRCLSEADRQTVADDGLFFCVNPP